MSMTNPFSCSDNKDEINHDAISPIYDFMMSGTGYHDSSSAADNRPQPALQQDGYMYKHNHQETIEDEEDTSRLT
jgi:hypothetical protein